MNREHKTERSICSKAANSNSALCVAFYFIVYAASWRIKFFLKLLYIQLTFISSLCIAVSLSICPVGRLSPKCANPAVQAISRWHALWWGLVRSRICSFFKILMWLSNDRDSDCMGMPWGFLSCFVLIFIF